MVSNEKQPPTGYLNTLRVFATFAVIMIHVFAPITTYFANSLTPLESYICVVLRNVWQWCVPVFVMISGVLFLDAEKNIPLEKMLKKYVFRIILAIIIFGIPYCFMEILFDSNLTFHSNQIGSAVLNALQGKSWDHLWYLYMIAGLYLCIPFIKIFVINASKDSITYILVLLFIFTSIIPSIERILPYKFGIYLPINSVYVFYVLLGSYIHYNKIPVKRTILWSFLIFYVLYVIFMPLHKNSASLSNGGYIILTGYNSPLVVMAAFAVFCLLYQKNKPHKIMETLAPLCFGIYLIHTLFINFLYKFIKLTPEKYPVILVIGVTLLITILFSLVFSYAARSIKMVRTYLL